MLLVCFRLVCQALALLLEGRDLRFHLCHLLLARGYPVQHFLARKGFEGIERLIVRDDILDDVFHVDFFVRKNVQDRSLD